MRVSHIAVLAAVLAIPSAAARSRMDRLAARSGLISAPRRPSQAPPLGQGCGPMAVPLHSGIPLAIRAR